MIGVSFQVVVCESEPTEIGRNSETKAPADSDPESRFSTCDNVPSPTPGTGELLTFPGFSRKVHKKKLLSTKRKILHVFKQAKTSVFCCLFGSSQLPAKVKMTIVFEASSPRDVRPELQEEYASH